MSWKKFRSRKTALGYIFCLADLNLEAALCTGYVLNAMKTTWKQTGDSVACAASVVNLVIDGNGGNHFTYFMLRFAVRNQFHVPLSFAGVHLELLPVFLKCTLFSIPRFFELCLNARVSDVLS